MSNNLNGCSVPTKPDPTLRTWISIVLVQGPSRKILCCYNLPAAHLNSVPLSFGRFPIIDTVCSYTLPDTWFCSPSSVLHRVFFFSCAVDPSDLQREWIDPAPNSNRGLCLLSHHTLYNRSHLRGACENDQSCSLTWISHVFYQRPWTIWILQQRLGPDKRSEYI